MNALKPMRILWLAFFFSGIAGISYELVWAKYLVYLFGASAPAVSVTVSIFFGGLALGAIVLGRFFDRSSRPVRAYGVLEIAIGYTSALVPWLVRLSERWLVGLESSGEAWTIRMLTAACVLLLPATLIGATFPAMAAAARRMRDPTRRTALFYGVNTLGAVFGCVLTGFFSIPAIGLKFTTLMMAVLNLAIGATVLYIGSVPRYSGPAEPTRKTENGIDAGTAPRSPRLSRTIVATLAGLSGLLAIGTEVLWVRALVLSFHGTVYVFAMVLTSYLIGIGGGSLLLARLRNFVKQEILLLGLLYLGIALSCFVAMILFPQFSDWTGAMRTAQIVNSWRSHIVTVGTLALLAMLPATLAMGASLPLLIGLADIPERESRIAGQLYGLNTFGGIVGSLLATFGLMPWLGLSGALMAHVAGYLILFAILGLTGNLGLSKRYMTAAPLAVAVLLGVFRIYPEVSGGKERVDARLLFYRDAPSGTVGIYHDERDVTSLWVNNQYGLSDTSPFSLLLHRRLGHLPILLHPSPQRALLIGLATGTTLAAMADHQLQQLDCVELHPTVVEVVSHFEIANHGVWRRPETRIQAGDGRRFLQRLGPTYDVIVGDLYLPLNAGVGALYSLEHFKAVKRRLESGGVFVAWLPLHQLAPQEVASIMRTFLEIFPEAEGWMGNWGRRYPILGLVGWKSPASPDSPRPTVSPIERALWDLSVQERGLEKQPQIQSRRLLSTERLHRWARGAPLNTFDHPIIEYSAPRSMMQAWIQNDPIYDKNSRVIESLLQTAGSPAPPQ